MIVDSQSNLMDSPPSYSASQSGDRKGPQSIALRNTSVQLNSKRAPTPQPPAIGPSNAYLTSPVVHHYVNPVTNEHIASLLPPDHPEMLCLQAGGHEPQTKFGIVGILAAVLWFPLGVGLCLLDRRVKCMRCGMRISDGVLG